MSEQASNPKRPKMTLTQWGICAIACVGFLFDTFVLLVLTLVVQPALVELLGTKPGSIVFNHWVGMLFYVPAVAGGIFGLLGGYLIDRLGRRRVLLWSIVLPAFATLATAFARTPMQLLVLRSLTFVGVSVEFVASTAWLAELFPIREQREAILGYTQGFSSLGGIVMSGAYYVAVTFSQHFPVVYGAHDAWRYTLMLGILPAIPVLLILPFLPESPIWLRKKKEGTLKRPSVLELFHPKFRKTALLTCLMMACAYAASFGMLQHFARIIPGTPGVRILPHAAQQQRVGTLQGWQEFGGLLGRFLMAFLAVRLLSRQKLLRMFQIPGLLLIPFVVLLPAVRDMDMSTWGIFLLGLVSVAQFNFWGNYLPLVYPVHLRGTGESFAANIGGRMLGTSAALITTNIVTYMPGGTAARQLAYAAGIVGFLAYAIGFVASFWLPEPGQDAAADYQ
ncbi:MAG TPA: MFS transporter [Candidatus Dormibacteraeota bacterium]|nr:MFS transporter [Candidatus Dormibacteraeota bacterium]